MYRVLLSSENQCIKTNVFTKPEWLLGMLTKPTLRKNLQMILSSYKLWASVKHSGKQNSCKFATEECAQEETHVAYFIKGAELKVYQTTLNFQAVIKHKITVLSLFHLSCSGLGSNQ